MTDAVHVGVVVDTMVVSWLFADRLNPRAGRYRQLIGAGPVLLSFQTVAAQVSALVAALLAAAQGSARHFHAASGGPCGPAYVR